jgi:hypothetical protein
MHVSDNRSLCNPRKGCYSKKEAIVKVRRFVMRRIRRLCVLLVPLAGLAGCSSAALQTPTLSSTPRNDYTNFYEASDFKEPERARFYLHPLPTDLAHIANDAKIVGVTNKKSKDFRDYLQNELMKRSDQICTFYITRIVHNFVQGNAAIKIGESLVKAVLVPIAVADSSFQAVSGSLQSNLSNEILQHELFKAVVKRIVERRATTRAGILTNQKQKLEDYSVSRAVYDSENYHSECNYAVQYVAGESTSQPPAPAKDKTEKTVIKNTPGGK